MLNYPKRPCLSTAQLRPKSQFTLLKFACSLQRGLTPNGFRRYARYMRYAQGGGLTAEGRRRREQARLAAVEKFGQRVPAAEIAAELRVSERSVQRWRRAWEAGGAPGLASKGQAARCRLGEDQLAELDRVLDAGPAASGWEGQRWTLARVRDLVVPSGACLVFAVPL